MQAGGQPGTLIRLLASHYRGMPLMANCMATWLQYTGMPGAEVEALVSDAVEGMVLSVFDPQRADAVFEDEQARARVGCET